MKYNISGGPVEYFPIFILEEFFILLFISLNKSFSLSSIISFNS